MGMDSSRYEITDKETKELLGATVSDVGYWQWWDEAEGDFMVEFGGVLLYDETKKGKQPRSSTIAISFWGNSFLVFLDNNEENSDWIDNLHNDMIDPFTLDPDGFIFDDKEYALDIMMRFKKRHGPFSSKDEARDTIMNSKSILAATAGDLGFIIGGDVCKVYGPGGDLSEDDIKTLSKKWWEYWKDYWKKRETDDEYEKDYACEVTIPYKKTAKEMEIYDKSKLIEFIRFEVDPTVFDYEIKDEELIERFRSSGTYKPNYQDLVSACRNMINLNIECSTLINWFYFICDDIADHYEGVWSERADSGYLWPNNENDIFEAMKLAIEDICCDEELYETSEELTVALKEVITIAENYEYNREHEMPEWRFSQIQRDWILNYFNGNTENVSNSRKALFKRIVDEECENGNNTAMLIKGYGCYGGDKVFECDWEESRKWITKLFEKSGTPQYANTLGYIYYYGRCNDGVPEYDKAFQYFSVGAAHDLIESMYKIADMFLGGKGCIKSPQTSDYIIDKLYWDCKNSFCHGDDAKFADVALRRAAAFERSERFTDALGYYLEADYAIKKRLKKSDFFGDKKVQENITKSIDNVKSKIPADYFVEEINISWPFWIYDMLDKDCKAKVEIESLGENRYRIRIDRQKKNHPGKALIVAPQLECATLTRIFESEFITDKPIEYKCKDKKNMKVNCIKYLKDGEYTFCNGDEEVFTIKDAEYILKKGDFK